MNKVQPMTVEYVIDLYDKYKSSLTEIKLEVLNDLRNRKNSRLDVMSDDIEIEIEILRILENRPKKLIEIGCHSGYATLHLINAIKHNNYGFLTSYDINDLCVGNIPDKYNTIFKFIQEDITTTNIDYDMDHVHWDAEHHDASFIESERQSLLKFKETSKIFIHDIYHHEHFPERDMAEELAEQLGGFISFSSIYYLGNFNKVEKFRKQSGISNFTLNKHSSVNPSIFIR